jgi:hypothetical protein
MDENFTTTLPSKTWYGKRGVREKREREREKERERERERF